MANLSYCRFQNTLVDLQECEEHMLDQLTGNERRAREQLVEVCRDIVRRWDLAHEKEENGDA